MKKQTVKKLNRGLPGRILQVDPLRDGASYYGEHVIQDFDVGLHWHNFTEVDFVNKGRGTHILNGSESNFSRGTVTVLSDSDFHTYQANGKIDIYSFHATDLIMSESTATLTHKLSGIQFSIDEEEIVQELENEFAGLFSELDLSDKEHEHFIRNRFERIILIIRRYGRAVTRRNSSGNEHNKEIVFVDRHFREPLTLDDVAERFHYSPTYFSKLFNKRYSITFQSYLLDKRLSWAYALVRLTDMPITEICYSAGFNNHAYFCRQFKRKYGVSPSALRTDGERDSSKKEQLPG